MDCYKSSIADAVPTIRALPVALPSVVLYPHEDMKKPTRKDFNVKRTRTGLGLFATRAYVKDDLVIEYTGERITDEEADRRANRYLFEINEKWTIDGSGRENLARYMNHSCKPNCEAEVDEGRKRIFIYAKKRIAPGDELTYDYGTAHFNEYIKPYGCRCEACRK